MSENSSDLPSPEVMNSLLPKFEFERLVESDGQSGTYLANQTSLDRTVNIKLFPPSRPNPSGMPSNFERAVAAVAALKHPNLVGIFDSGNIDDRPYLVLEAVIGKTLRQTTQGNALDSSKAFALISGICEGLKLCHRNGVIHGALNPSNVLVNSEGTPKLGNFGMNQSAIDRSSPYAAPELANPNSYATKRSDVFSLAAIYQELMTGSPTGLTEAPIETLSKQKQDLATVLKQAMDPEPGKRMPDADAFFIEISQHQGCTARLLISASPKKAAPIQQSKRATKQVQVEKQNRGPALKLCLIAVLIISVFIAWTTLNRAKTARYEENKELMAQAQAKKDAALAEALKRTSTPTQYSSPKTISKTAIAPVERTESQEDALQRLRAPLLSGKRSEMPPGTLSRGGSKYLLIEEPMTWNQANEFAESFGAHLANASKASTLLWIGEKLIKNEPAWVGAAKNGKDSWVTVSGKFWSPEISPSGDETFAALNKQGKIISKDASETLPFIVQWRNDGSNPGTREVQFKATADTVESKHPIYPPGTVEAGGRSLLYIPEATTWTEAKKAAESAAGHLFVASDKDEAKLLRSYLQNIEAPNGIWLGASLDSDRWTWITSEPWTFADWVKGRKPGKEGHALVFHPDRGWDSQDRSLEASGYVIEWSNDSSEDSETPPVELFTGLESSELAAKAKELVINTEKKRDELLAINAKKMTWDLNALLKGMNSGGRAHWGPEVDDLKSLLKEDRINTGDIRRRNIRVSPEMAKIVNYAEKKQNEADQGSARAITKIRDAYVEKMQAIQEQAKAVGQMRAAERAGNMIQNADDAKGWARDFGVDLP